MRGRYAAPSPRYALALRWREAARAAFSREVEAIARMDHPHIVRVHDHGRVDAASAGASGGRLRAGQPYLVMELAQAANLHGWPRVRFEAQRRLAGLHRMQERRRLAEALLRDALAELDPEEAERLRVMIDALEARLAQ